MATFYALPAELLEHIAYLTPSPQTKNPTSTLISLSLTCRRLHGLLSWSHDSNEVLWRRVCYDLFDPPSLPFVDVSTKEMIREMQLRIKALRDGDVIRAYIMVLEHRSKNLSYLLSSRSITIRSILKNYFAPDEGVDERGWIDESFERGCALALAWFLYHAEGREEIDITDGPGTEKRLMRVCKVVSLGTHKYAMTHPSLPWYLHRGYLGRPPSLEKKVTVYGREVVLRPPSIAITASSIYLTLMDAHQESSMPYPLTLSPPPPSPPPSRHPSIPRGLGTINHTFIPMPTREIGLGLEGIWEGLFTYLDFHLFAELLSGARAETLERTIVPRHRQTWKLREYHHAQGQGEALQAGEALEAWIPSSVTLIENVKEGYLDVEGGQEGRVRYFSPSSSSSYSLSSPSSDIILKGEGHSAWGHFTLTGRVRPLDGLFSLVKEYVGEEGRGTWVYRGFLLGFDGNGGRNSKEQLVGRWRDTLTPAAGPGYEGGFLMRRRG